MGIEINNKGDINMTNIKITYGFHTDVRKYKDNIENYIKIFIQELENKGKSKLARKITNSQIEVEFTQESGTKKLGRDASFNKTRTQTENQKGIKSIIINVKSKGKSNQFYVFRVTFKGNILSDKDLENIKETLEEIDSKIHEKVRKQVLKVKDEVYEGLDNNDGDKISTLAEAMEMVQEGINYANTPSGDIISAELENIEKVEEPIKPTYTPSGEKKVIDPENFDDIISDEKFYDVMLDLLNREDEIEKVSDNTFFVSEGILNEIIFEHFSGIGKHKIIESLIKRGFKSVIRINYDNYGKSKIKLDELSKSTIEILKWGLLKEIDSDKIGFIGIEHDYIKTAIEMAGGEASNLQGFFQKINKGSTKDNPTFKKGFILSF